MRTGYLSAPPQRGCLYPLVVAWCPGTCCNGPHEPSRHVFPLEPQHAVWSVPAFTMLTLLAGRLLTVDPKSTQVNWYIFDAPVDSVAVEAWIEEHGRLLTHPFCLQVLLGYDRAPVLDELSARDTAAQIHIVGMQGPAGDDNPWPPVYALTLTAKLNA